MPTYTDLSNIKRIVRSSNEKVVRFSDSLVSISLKEADKDNRDFIFDRNEVDVDSSYQGDRVLEFHFKSASDFDVIEVDEGYNRDILIDQSQSKSSDYTTPDGKITVKTSAWGGTQEQGDEVRLKFDSHISDDSANIYIEEAEMEIDGFLMSQGAGHIASGDNRVFPTSSDVPNTISVATSYLASYYIYTDVYLSIYKEGGGLSNYSNRWKRKAEKNIQNYIDKKLREVPIAVTFPRFIDKMGVENQWPGLDTIKEKYDDWNRDAHTKGVFTMDYDIEDTSLGDQ